MTQHIGAIIREARRAQGLTQEQLASYLHVSRQTVSHWENGRAEPGYETLKSPAAPLNLDLSQLFTTPPDSSIAPTDAPPPAAPEPVMPSPAEATDSKPVWNIPVRLQQFMPLLIAALLILSVFSAVVLLHMRTPYPLRWFEQELSYANDQPHMHIYTHESPIIRKGTGKSGKWDFHLFFKEQNGYAFEVSNLQLVWFRRNGSQHIDTILPEEFLAFTGSTRIGAGEIRFITIGKPTAYDLVRLGCILRGTDDSGQELAFRMTVPLE